MQGYIERFIKTDIMENLRDFPVVAILGPRQCGKSTLAKHLSAEIGNVLYLDLEKNVDYRKLNDPELFLGLNRNKTIIIDEVQLYPELFVVLRSIVDETNNPGQFLILGSASRDLIKQSSESLAGRIAYVELTPFLFSEIRMEYATNDTHLFKLWLQGGFPRSFLAKNEERSFVWRVNFIRTFLERDIPQLGFQIPIKIIGRLWQMLAHNQGQLFNSSKLGNSLGRSYNTIRSYVDLLEQTFVLLVLPPYSSNLRKRLVKSPKIYIRDSGLLHTLLEIKTKDDLFGHPVFGQSWEGFVINTIISFFPQYRFSFYRTSAGGEIDLIMEYGNKLFAIECKASSAPQLSRGTWNAIDHIKPYKTWVVAPQVDYYPLKEHVFVSSLERCIDELLVMGTSKNPTFEGF